MNVAVEVLLLCWRSHTLSVAKPETRPIQDVQEVVKAAEVSQSSVLRYGTCPEVKVAQRYAAKKLEARRLVVQVYIQSVQSRIEIA